MKTDLDEYKDRNQMQEVSLKSLRNSLEETLAAKGQLVKDLEEANDQAATYKVRF